MTQLPQVPLTLSVVSFIGTLIAIGCISALMTFVDARRIFSNKQKDTALPRYSEVWHQAANHTDLCRRISWFSLLI